MHELSLAQSVVEIAVAEATKAGCSRVTSITIEAGVWSGVVREALEFAMTATVKDTMAEGAELIIIEVPGRVKCNACHTEFAAEEYYNACPKCNSTAVSVISGRELQVKSVTAE